MCKNSYTTSLFDKTLTYFLNKLHRTLKIQPEGDVNTVKNYQIILLYLGRFTSRAEKKLSKD